MNIKGPNKIVNFKCQGARDLGMDKVAIIEIESPKYGLQQAFIDSDQVGRVAVFRWFVHRHRSGTFYVQAYPKKGHHAFGSSLALHRLIMRCPKDKLIDHINGNPLDNRKANLRIVNLQENALNRRPQRNNRIGQFKGVVGAERGFYAYIGYKGKRHFLGAFETREQAAEAYNQAALKLHGEHARLNRIAA